MAHDWQAEEESLNGVDIWKTYLSGISMKPSSIRLAPFSFSESNCTRHFGKPRERFKSWQWHSGGRNTATARLPRTIRSRMESLESANPHAGTLARCDASAARKVTAACDNSAAAAAARREFSLLSLREIFSPERVPLKATPSWSARTSRAGFISGKRKKREERATF